MNNSQEHTERKRANGCKNPTECSCSSDMFDGITFGWGDLDTLGYWEHGCTPCADAYAKDHPGTIVIGE